jgi:hypothetical protein
MRNRAVSMLLFSSLGLSGFAQGNSGNRNESEQIQSNATEGDSLFQAYFDQLKNLEWQDTKCNWTGEDKITLKQSLEQLRQAISKMSDDSLLKLDGNFRLFYLTKIQLLKLQLDICLMKIQFNLDNGDCDAINIVMKDMKETFDKALETNKEVALAIAAYDFAHNQKDTNEKNNKEEL